LESAVAGRDGWHRGAERVGAGGDGHVSGASQADRYVGELQSAVSGARPSGRHAGAGRMPVLDRLVVTDFDDTLTGDDEGLHRFTAELVEAGPHVGFGIATGRTLDRALALIDDPGIPAPDALTTAPATPLHYGDRPV